MSGATIQKSSGSVSTTLNSTGCIACLTKNKSPFFTGRYASKKYGFKYTSNRLPVTPSIVSSNGNTWIRLPYGTSWHAVTVTTSPKRIRKFLRTTLFIKTLLSSQFSSAKQIHIVSRDFLPLIITVSPRNSCNSSIFAGDNAITLLSSFDASSTINLFGDLCLGLPNIASDTSFLSSPPSDMFFFLMRIKC